MAQQEEIVLWIDRHWKNAIEKRLKDETLQEHLENVLDELCNQLPAHEYERISRAIQSEADAQRAEEEAARTYAAYHVVENGQEWYFKTTPGEELLDACKKLRSYITTEENAAPDLFIKMLAGGQPITAEEYDALIVLRMQNTGKNRGVFDVNFNKREFSAVHIMDGWQTWAMQDVSVAAYHATRSTFAPAKEQWSKLLDHLSGKEITSAGHLSARNFSFGEEIIEADGKLNFYVQADFDVDAAFSTFVCTDQNDDWLNIYANYDTEKDCLCDELELNLCKGDGTEENWNYHLNAAEQEVLARKMEEFCQQQTGMSLHEYAQRFREEQSAEPEIKDLPAPRMESGEIDYEPVRAHPLDWRPAAFKGTKAVAVILPDGNEVEAKTWRAVVEIILKDCAADPVRLEHLRCLCDRVNGNFRPLLSSRKAEMKAPVEIEDGLHFESKFDTEQLLRVLVEKVLRPVGYDCSSVLLRYRERTQTQEQAADMESEQSADMTMTLL